MYKNKLITNNKLIIKVNNKKIRGNKKSSLKS